jgi:hypothetical protein
VSIEQIIVRRRIAGFWEYSFRGGRANAAFSKSPWHIELAKLDGTGWRFSDSEEAATTKDLLACSLRHRCCWNASIAAAAGSCITDFAAAISGCYRFCFE